jgi:hypothetical protein
MQRYKRLKIDLQLYPVKRQILYEFIKQAEGVEVFN